MGNGMQRKYNERRMGKMVSDIMKNFQAQLNKGLLVNHIRFYTAPLQKSHHTKFFSCGRQCWFPDANLLSCILALPNIYSFLAGGSLYLQNVSRQTFQSNQRACIWEPCHQKMLSLMFRPLMFISDMFIQCSWQEGHNQKNRYEGTTYQFGSISY